MPVSEDNPQFFLDTMTKDPIKGKFIQRFSRFTVFKHYPDLKCDEYIFGGRGNGVDQSLADSSGSADF